MSLIMAVAYLNLCECGKHGNIVFADGSKTQNFCSKEVARQELEKGLEEKKLTQLEADVVKSQLDQACKLASSEASASLVASLVSELENFTASCLEGTETNHPWVM